MPTRTYPKFQQVLPLDGHSHGSKNVIVTQVEINDATTTYFVLPGTTTDVSELKDARTDTAATFYLGGTGETVVNIDGGTIGAKHYFASLHGDLAYEAE